VPSQLLKQDISEVTVEEFVKLLGISRFVQKLESDVLARGIAEVFNE